MFGILNTVFFIKVHRRKLMDLKLAFSEFYLSLILLQNYQNLNFTGFRKILKKHDKLLRNNTGARYLNFLEVGLVGPYILSFSFIISCWGL